MSLLAVLLPLVDPTPADNDVVAGWGGFLVFVGLAIAVVVIALALRRSLRVARKNFGVDDEKLASEGPEDRAER